MKVFLVYVRDEAYASILPEDKNGTRHGENGQSAQRHVRAMAFPPLGIQTLAPVLREAGHETVMFDTCHPEMKAEHIAEALDAQRPDVVALSVLSVTAYPALVKLVPQLKARSADMHIIVGGPFASVNPLHILRDCTGVDAVGVGEGEELLPDYLEHLDEPGFVAGLVWRNGAELVSNPPRPLLQDLDRFPYADRTSLPIEYIESLPLDVPAVLSFDKFCTIQTSRGCPYTCIYCDIPSLYEGKWRHRSAEHVLGEMQQLSDAGYRSIYLTDDHFLLKRSRIESICKGIIERKLEFKWGCEGRVDSVGVDHFPLMTQANCSWLAFGVESGAQRVLDRLGKRQTLEQVQVAVKAAKRHGFERIHGFFVIGAPSETAEEILQTFRFAARLEIDTFGFNRLAAYRGTPLWREYVSLGILDDEQDWNKSFKCSNIDPRVLPDEEVNRLRRKGYTLLLGYRLRARPLQTLRLLRTFGRHMKKRDLLRLISGPFRKQPAKSAPALPVGMVEAGLLEPVRTQSETASV